MPVQVQVGVDVDVDEDVHVHVSELRTEKEDGMSSFHPVSQDWQEE